MADLSHWIAQACEYHDSEGTFKVIYFQDRQELITVGEELQRNGDSWSDTLLRSNMGSNVDINQVIMPSPDSGSWQPHSHVPDPSPAPNPAPVPSGNNDLNRFFSKELFKGLPGSSISSAAPKGLFKDLPGSSISSAAPKVQEIKEKEELIKYKKSIEKPRILDRFTKLFKTLTRDRRVYSIEDYKTKNQHQYEDGSSLPEDLIRFLDDPNDDPFKHARPPGYCKYALVFGIHTEFNPSGVWVIEELFNDVQESDF